MRGLIERLKSDPSLENVYFDNEGTWLFDPKNSHPIKKSRQEILDMEAELPAEEVKKEDAIDFASENILLKEKIEILETENQSLQAGISADTSSSAEWINERRELKEKIEILETQLQKITDKKKR